MERYLHKTEKRTIVLQNSVCLGPYAGHSRTMPSKLIMIDDYGEFMSLVLKELLLLCLTCTDFNTVHWRPFVRPVTKLNGCFYFLFSCEVNQQML